MKMKLSRYHVITPPFFDEQERSVKRIVYSTRTASIRIVDEASWKRIENGDFRLLDSNILLDFSNIELIVPSDEKELQTIISQNQNAISNDDTLYLAIQPTASCQLGCHYCGQQHTKKLLREEEQNLFIERTRTKLESKKFRKLSLAWFGGEPLIGLPAMRLLTPKLKLLAESFNCIYESKIVTNGLALTEKVATVVVHHLSIQSIEITLDGLAEFHDARRMQKNGEPTFNKIFTNLCALAQRNDFDGQISVRCNVDHQNYQSVSSLIHLLAKEGLQERISFYAAPIHSWGNDAHLQSLSAEEFAAWEIKWLSEMFQLGFQPKIIPDRRPIVCMAVKQNSELIDAYGNIFNCSEVSYVPTYGNHNEYAIGHLSSGETEGKRQRLGSFNEQIEQGEYPCSSCRMLPVCGGSCPKQWQEGLEPCPSAKHNIEQRLLLSYAISRLKKEASTV